MYKLKLLVSLLLAVSILIVQTGGVFAASALQTSPSIKGPVQSITLETYSTTGITVAIVTVVDSDQLFQVVRISEKTAKHLGLVSFDGDGKLVINNSALGKSVEIKPEMILPEQEEDRHPVGNALATFFSDIVDLDYDTIMLAHNEGIGFGVIAQALWLTTKLGGNAEVFHGLLLAKETGDFKDFVLEDGTEDGTTPKNWAELRKALLDGKKLKNLGSVMSNKDDGNGNHPEKDKNKDKEKDKGGNGKNEENDKEKKSN